MKITNKKNTDPIAEAKKSPHFKKYCDEANVRIRLAAAVYNARTGNQMSQQDLARKVETTQKVISNIENADVNVRLPLIYRLSRALDFNSKTLSNIFNCDFVCYSIMCGETANSQIEKSSAKLVY